MRTPDNNLLCLRPERCRSLPVVPVALGDRLLPAPLLAFIVVIEDRAFRADDPGATVAIGLEALLADQRTDPRRLELERVERVGACELDVEPGAGMPVEQRQRALRRRVPFAIGSTAQTADTAQLDLHRFCNVGRRWPVAQRGNVRRLCFPNRRRAGSNLVGGLVVGDNLAFGSLVFRTLAGRGRFDSR